MNPQEPQQQDHQSEVTPPAYVQPLEPESPKKTKKRLALILIIGPTMLFILAIIIMIISNALFNTQVYEGEVFEQVPIGKTILNILTFLFAAIAFLMWLPGLVIGIILLAKQSK